MIRRTFLLAGTALLVAPPVARATKPEVAALIAELTGGAPSPPGGLKLEIPELVENGNTVAMTLTAAPPPGVSVESLHVFAEANPYPTVLRLRLGPGAVPRISTRIRLATSQTVHAVAKLSDGTCREDSVALLVTLAACLD